MLLVSGCGYRAIGLSFAPAEQTLSTPVTDRPLPLSERDLAEPIVLAQVATDPSGGSMKVDSGLMPGRQTEGG
ncbi:MAG: hypothetical protein HW416_916, partial [Chloroflexi bacterium]|nr:hypothetical protein [Chloroflexota bacterium]